MNNNKRVITDTLSTRDEVTGYFIFILLFGFLLFMGFYAWPKAPIVSCWLWLMCLICIAAYLLNRSRSVCWFSLEGDVLRYRKLGFSEQRALSLSDIRKIAIDKAPKSSRISGFHLEHLHDGRKLNFWRSNETLQLFAELSQHCPAFDFSGRAMNLPEDVVIRIPIRCSCGLTCFVTENMAGMELNCPDGHLLYVPSLSDLRMRSQPGVPKKLEYHRVKLESLLAQ